MQNLSRVQSLYEGAEPKEGAETTEKNADGTPKTTTDDTKPLEATPQNVRTTLKSLKDADAKNAPIVKELHGAYERWTAAKQIFPKGVAEMKAAKELNDLVGGPEGWEATQQVVEAIKASDEKIYSGDASIHDDIVEDLKAEGKLDQYPKLVTAGVEKLKQVDPKAYETLSQPILHSELMDANFHGALGSLVKALTLPADATPEVIAKAVKDAFEVATGMNKWWTGLDKANKQVASTKVDPERVKLEEERKKFSDQQKEFATKQTKEFQTAVSKEADTVSKNALGKALQPFTKMAYFKGYTRDNYQPLAATIMGDLYDTLKADKTYQAQMKALWGAKSPDKAKILEYHTAKVQSLANDIVRRSVQKMYPDHAKDGAAAGRVKAANDKKAATAKTDAAAAATGKPVYVAVKPSWDSIDWDKDPKQHLYIAGKAYFRWRQACHVAQIVVRTTRRKGNKL